MIKKYTPIFQSLFLFVFSTLIVWQHIEIRNLQGEFKKDCDIKTKQIQRLDAGIDFQTKRAKFLIVARDSILKKHRKSLTDGEAYRIAEFGLYVCEKYRLNPVLLFAVGRRESRFDIKAESNKGAKGIYQIMPLTGRILCDALDIEYNESMLFNMKVNTEMAGKYLNYLQSEYSDLDLILIGYNAGPKWANRYRVDKKTKLPEETIEYVKAVKKYYEEFSIRLAFYLPGNSGGEES